MVAPASKPTINKKGKIEKPKLARRMTSRDITLKIQSAKVIESRRESEITDLSARLSRRIYQDYSTKR